MVLPHSLFQTVSEDVFSERVQTACARAGEVLAGAPLDDGNVDPRQRQLARQHQPRRTSSGDHHRVLGHSRTPAGMTPVATSASHPSATAATVSNCAATNSAARRGRSAADGGVAPVTSGRTGWPTGTSGTPTRASSSAPSARNRTASPTIGSTSPRDPYVDNNTPISLLPFP